MVFVENKQIWQKDSEILKTYNNYFVNLTAKLLGFD